MTLSDFPLTLVLGGQRSGKSAYAESLFLSGGLYIATGQKTDEEMQARIKAHQDRRGENWQTVEEPIDLILALKALPKDKPVLIDSLGLWVSNRMYQDKALETDALVDALFHHPAPVVVVSEQVGEGVIPMNEVARSFVDALGLVNQIVAAKASRVVLVTAGLAQILKEQK